MPVATVIAGSALRCSSSFSKPSVRRKTAVSPGGSLRLDTSLSSPLQAATCSAVIPCSNSIFDVEADKWPRWPLGQVGVGGALCLPGARGPMVAAFKSEVVLEVFTGVPHSVDAGIRAVWALNPFCSAANPLVSVTSHGSRLARFGALCPCSNSEFFHGRCIGLFSLNFRFFLG